MKKLTKIMFYIPKKILIKVIFFLFLLLCFNFYVNAETINNTCSSINQACSTNGRYTYSLYQSEYDTYSTGTFKTTYNGRADYIVFSFDYDLLGNATYQLSISANSTDFRNISKSNVWIESTDSCAHGTGYLDITNVSFSKSKIVITFKTVSSTPRFMVLLGDPEGPAITGVSTFGISSIDITTVESNDTQNIIDNNNQNTNSIIDNANDNTDKIIGSINDNFNNCRDSYNLFNINSTPVNYNVSTSVSNNKILLVNNTNTGATSLARASFPLTLKKNTTYSLSFDYSRDNLSNSNLVGIRQLSDGGSWLSVTPSMLDKNGKINFTFNSGNNTTAYLWFYIKNSSTETAVLTNWVLDNIMLVEGSISLPYEEYGKEICSNKLDDTNDKLDNISGTLNDGSPPDTESFLDQLDNVFNDGPISTLILMPLNLINHYVDGFNSTCSPINLGELYGTDLELPCINLENKLGSTLWTTVDGLISIFMIYNICMLFVSAFNDITSLRDTFDSLYVPQHAKPLGKHTSEVE